MISKYHSAWNYPGTTRKGNNTMGKSFNYFVFYSDGTRFAADKASAILTNVKKTRKPLDHVEVWEGGEYVRNDAPRDENEAPNGALDLWNNISEALNETPSQSGQDMLETRIHLKTLQNVIRGMVNSGSNNAELVSSCFQTFVDLGVSPEQITGAIQNYYPSLIRGRRQQHEEVPA